MRSHSRQAARILRPFAAIVGLVFLPALLWAIRPPDGPGAPLPDYDIRKGYSGGASVLRDPRVAQEVTLLRQQREAKQVPTGVWEPTPSRVTRAELETIFGPDVLVEWNANGTPRSLSREDAPLSLPQFGGEPEEAARQFFRTHARLFRLSGAAVDALRVVRRNRLGTRLH
ncbi:MAG: hypothetical protein ACE5G6_00265 [Terriglobia bacterium]